MERGMTDVLWVRATVILTAAWLAAASVQDVLTGGITVRLATVGCVIAAYSVARVV